MISEKSFQSNRLGSAQIAAPEPGLSAGEIIERAAALRDRLRESQEESDRTGTYSEDLHEVFKEAGFYRAIQPRMFGGYEFGYETFIRLQIEIGRGSPGVAWCLGLASSHSATVASHWSEKAQRDFFGSDGHFVAPHSAMPGGTLVKVEGGFRVDGVWRYCSGVPYSTHFIGTAILPGPEGKEHTVNFVAPRKDYEILDDWGGDRVLGLQSSGSNSIRLRDVFVPDEYISPFTAFYTQHDFSTDTPGTALHGNPLYLGQLMGPYIATITAPIVGAAKAAIDEYELLALTRTTVNQSSVPRADNIDQQRNMGEALMLADAAEAVLIDVCRRHDAYSMRWAKDRTPFTLEENLRLWGMCQAAGSLACDAVELLFRTAGSSVARKGSKLVRYLNDAAMYRTHGSTQFMEMAATIGRVHLGRPAKFLDL